MAEEPPEEIPWDQRFAELTAPMRYLEFRRENIGALNAAFAVGWTPAELRRMRKDPEFAEMESVMLERRVETVEQRVWEMASKPNPSRWAVEMALFCQASERGWRPPTQRIETSKTVKIDATITASVVDAVRQALVFTDIAALQPGGAIEAIEATARDDLPE